MMKNTSGGKGSLKEMATWNARFAAESPSRRPSIYIIHLGAKNLRIKGYLNLVKDERLGKEWLVGEEITGTHRLRDEIVETLRKVKHDITGLKCTVRLAGTGA